MAIYKAIIKPIWTYGIALWGNASKSHLQLIQRTQSKMLRIITKPEWYIRNEDIDNDLNIETVNETILKKQQKTDK